jgi:hypothetical protein
LDHEMRKMLLPTRKCSSLNDAIMSYFFVIIDVVVMKLDTGFFCLFERVDS